MDDLDIDETLPGQEQIDEDSAEKIRRENELGPSSELSSSDGFNGDSPDEDSQRGMLYLVAGAGYGTLLVYLVLVIYKDVSGIPFLSSGNTGDKEDALYTAILISIMVFFTIWLFLDGKNLSFFESDPDKAKFYAGLFGLASLVVIVLMEDYQREMIVSAILTLISTWSYIISSQMKS